MNNFQRVGSESNAHVGRDFEAVAHDYFLEIEGLKFQKSFPIAPTKYHKILFVLRATRKRRDESLEEYYVRDYSRLVPSGASIVEFDEDSRNAVLVKWTVFAVPSNTCRPILIGRELGSVNARACSGVLEGEPRRRKISGDHSFATVNSALASGPFT